MLTDDAVLTGGRDNSRFAFCPITGKVLYNCTRDGCTNKQADQDLAIDVNSVNASPVIVNQLHHILRAIHTTSSSERWNLSLLQNDVCLQNRKLDAKSNSVDSCKPDDNSEGSSFYNHGEVGGVKLNFCLNKSLVLASSSGEESNRRLWSFRSPEHIVKAWIYSHSSDRLTPISLFSSDSTALSYVADTLHQHTPFPSYLSRSGKSTILPHYHPSTTPSSRSKTLINYVPRFLSKAFGRRSWSRQSTSYPTDTNQVVFLGQLNSHLFVQHDDHLPTSMDLLPSRIALDTQSLSTIGNARSEDRLIGFHRAYYDRQPASELCRQPFISSSHLTYAQDDHLTHTTTALLPTGDSYSSVDDDEREEIPPPQEPSSHFYDWILTGPADLMSLISHAKRVDQADSSQNKQDVSNESASQNESSTNRTLTWLWLTSKRVANSWRFLVSVCILSLTAYFTVKARTVFVSTGSTDLQSEQAYVEDNNSNKVESQQPSPNSTSSSSKRSKTPSAKSLPSDPPDALAVNSLASDQSEQFSSTPTANFSSIYEAEFEFVRCLGRGGFGRVFESRNRMDDCCYAVKRIPIWEDGETSKDTFLREVKVLAQLDHPGIVRYNRAWTEHPPIGWQQARDAELFDVEDSDDCESDGYNASSLSLANGGARTRQQIIDNLTSPVGRQGNESVSGDGSNESSMNNPILQRQPEVEILFQSNESGNGNTQSSGVNGCKPYSTWSISTTSVNEETSSPLPIGGDSSALRHRHKQNRLAAGKRNKRSASRPDPIYLYIQMQLCSSRSLRDWLAETSERPQLPHLIDMFRQLVDAVAYLHAHQLMHRDVKPSNVLFDLSNPFRLKLADFGLVKQMIVDNGQTDAVTATNGSDHPLAPNRDNYQRQRSHTKHVGTDLYMSPEQEQGFYYDHTVDIFALGLIFIELLLTFSTEMERIVTLKGVKSHQFPTKFIQDRPKEHAIAIQMLDHDPHLRPSASKLLTDPFLTSVALTSSTNIST